MHTSIPLYFYNINYHLYFFCIILLINWTTVLRFLRDSDDQEIWIQKSKRGDAWNHSKSYICSKHFKSEDFVRDLKSAYLRETKLQKKFL